MNILLEIGLRNQELGTNPSKLKVLYINLYEIYFKNLNKIENTRIIKLEHSIILDK